MTDRSTSFTQLDLERYLLGELDPTRHQALEQACQTDPELQRRLDAMQQENTLFSDNYPFQMVRQRFQVSATRSRTRTRSWMPAVASLALVLVVIGSVAIWQPEQRSGAIDTERLKGLEATGLLVYRQSAGAPEHLQDNSLVRPGDVLQIAYQNHRPIYGAILSVDGSTQVTVHLPTKGLDAARLLPEGLTRLPFAYQLDDAPEFERFYLFWQTEPFDIVLLQALLHTQDLQQKDLPAGMHVQTLTLRKEQ